ncbi:MULTISPECIES: hypothetical protein [Methanococcoides]|uniref:Uncharacterized protein n=1 Tax=Methanococcoides seepicolus TaxID=2828780 RepID=A0A9E5DC15_9EURY|nr:MULTISPECIES: hypothetical protein [Methanococcoides]MCM1987671.1 hypothetical protein [Methanococcoides seepicolus]NOQ48293.1 hypothetical protein [Methanococcoides sp.]
MDIEMQASVREDELKKELMAKLDLSEDTLSKISQMGEEPVGVTKNVALQLPIANGFGKKTIGTFNNPCPWTITAKVHAKITAPSNGSWRIRVSVNNKVEFDRSGITPNIDISTSIKIKGWSKSTVVAEAWWSEKTDTTLNVEANVTI